MKKFLAIFMCLAAIMLSWSTSVPAVAMAGSIKVGNELSELETQKTSLSEAELLEDEQIIAIVEYQIITYLESELDMNEKISPNTKDTWVHLNDLDGNRFAELVPLINEKYEEVAYITVGAIKDGFSQYMMEWDVTLLNELRYRLDQYEKSEAIFFPPMEYGIKYEQDGKQHIVSISMKDFKENDITEFIDTEGGYFQERYKNIRNSINEYKNECIIMGSERLHSRTKGACNSETLDGINPASTMAVKKIDERLKCEWKDTKSFVPIKEDDGTTTYGGKQAWYGNSVGADRGCGPVAASNILYYMSASSTNYKKLYPYTSLTKTNFVNFMISIYKQISPAPFGETSYNSFASDVSKWADKQGVSLTVHKAKIEKNNKASVESSFIDALKKDKPVALLNWCLDYRDPGTNKEKVGWHWVTVTKYFQSTNDTRWIGVSSWGRRLSLDWDAYYQSIVSGTIPDAAPGTVSVTFGGAYVWFE